MKNRSAFRAGVSIGLVLTVFGVAGCGSDSTSIDDVNDSAESSVAAWVTGSDGTPEDPATLDDLAARLGGLTERARSESKSLDACRLAGTLESEPAIVDGLRVLLCDDSQAQGFQAEGFVLAAALSASSSDDIAAALSTELAMPVTWCEITMYIKAGEGSYDDISLLANDLTAGLSDDESRSYC